uniref:Elongator complex protein 1 isoform 2 n=1 Tax=uncultured bacterium pAW1 TaxID=1781155 RepID=A0A1C9U4P5_9BACT|nr:elongator complex protein 1 isoform 2 [uncultured bacterium pAW1]
MHRIWVAVIFVLLSAEYCFGVKPVLGVKVGVGYDLLSQEYFLDSAIAEGPDSLLTRWTLRTTYLDDIKARIDFNVTHPDRRSYSFRSTYEQARELIRVRLNGDWRPTVGPIALEWRGQTDWRVRYRDTSKPGDTYFSGSGSIRARYPFSSQLSTFVQAQGNIVSFEYPAQYVYDYYRVGGKVGMELISATGLAGVSAFLLQRQVPDSQNLDYDNAGLDASWLSSYGWGDLDLFARFDHKNYNQPGDQDDYRRLELTARSRQGLGQRYFLRQEVEAAQYFYNDEDLLNASFLELAGVVQMGYQSGGLMVGAGPEGKILREEDKNGTTGEDYTEGGLQLDLDYLGSSLFGSLEWSTGYRTLALESEGQTDFFYQRLNILFDWTLQERWTFSLFGAAEWEWHSPSSDDSRLYLLSTALSYSF